LAHVPACLAITYLFYHMHGHIPSITVSDEYTLQNYVRPRQSVHPQCAPSV
jgi:hypothetical protein